jgi:hypothetical protein
MISSQNGCISIHDFDRTRKKLDVLFASALVLVTAAYLMLGFMAVYCNSVTGLLPGGFVLLLMYPLATALMFGYFVALRIAQTIGPLWLFLFLKSPPTSISLMPSLGALRSLAAKFQSLCRNLQLERQHFCKLVVVSNDTSARRLTLASVSQKIRSKLRSLISISHISSARKISDIPHFVF